MIIGLIGLGVLWLVCGGFRKWAESKSWEVGRKETEAAEKAAKAEGRELTPEEKQKAQEYGERGFGIFLTIGVVVLAVVGVVIYLVAMQG